MQQLEWAPTCFGVSKASSREKPKKHRDSARTNCVDGLRGDHHKGAMSGSLRSNLSISIKMVKLCICRLEGSPALSLNLLSREVHVRLLALQGSWWDQGHHHCERAQSPCYYTPRQ